MAKKVLKFGGTSVGSIDRIEHAANIVKREQQNEKILSKESKEILLNLFKDPNKANIRELAKQIKTGELKLYNKELQEVLIEITKKKISVDNPKYSTYKKLIE